MFVDFDEEDPESRAVSLQCGHQFSTAAWRYYLQEKVKSGTMCTKTKCQQTRCNVAVPNSLFESILEDTDDYAYLTKYRAWCTKQYSDANKQLKPCRAPDCDRMIKLSTSFSGDFVSCECGASFCLKCESEAHEPVSCEMRANWMKMTQGIDVDKMWMSLNTKPCPGCRAPVMKDDGCMTMICLACGYDFCWMCMKYHGDHQTSCTQLIQNMAHNYSLQRALN